MGGHMLTGLCHADKFLAMNVRLSQKQHGDLVCFAYLAVEENQQFVSPPPGRWKHQRLGSFCHNSSKFCTVFWVQADPAFFPLHSILIGFRFSWHLIQLSLDTAEGCIFCYLNKKCYHCFCCSVHVGRNQNNSAVNRFYVLLWPKSLSPRSSGGKLFLQLQCPLNVLHHRLMMSQSRQEWCS